MHEELNDHYEKALSEYTNGVHYETLIEAKKEYFELTGMVDEDDDDYENRMSSFNDWYILQFISKRGTRTVIKDYLEKNQVKDSICKSFLEFNHSLFELTGKSFGGHDIIKDILHDFKFTLPKDHPKLSLLKGDIFLGRVLTYSGKSFLMDGIIILPKDTKSILKKQARKVRKCKLPEEEFNFLMQTEGFRTKWRHYGHIDVNKIFVFEDPSKKK